MTDGYDPAAGDRLWQLGLGGAFKCNSAIWRAVRNVSEAHPCWAEGVGAVEESELAEIARWRAENAAAAEGFFAQADAASGTPAPATLLARAESLALPAGDREAFEQLLRQAIETAAPRRDLASQVLHERASWLLETIDDRF